MQRYNDRSNLLDCYLGHEAAFRAALADPMTESAPFLVIEDDAVLHVVLFGATIQLAGRAMPTQSIGHLRRTQSARTQQSLAIFVANREDGATILQSLESSTPTQVDGHYFHLMGHGCIPHECNPMYGDSGAHSLIAKHIEHA